MVAEFSRQVSCGPDLPEPWSLPPGFDRYQPSRAAQRAAILDYGRRLDWADLDWLVLVDALIAVGRTDIPLARLTEGHLDALRILREAGETPRADAAYGVWASRSHGTGVRFAARSPSAGADEMLAQLAGTLRFASGAGVLDRALVPVWVDDDTHLLLDLAVSDWPVDERAWKTSAMATTRSHTINLDRVVAAGRQIGPANFYRKGFQLGGVGVAAVWAGGCARVLDLLDRYQLGRRNAAQQVRRGLAAADLATAVAGCREAARLISADLVTDTRTTATLVRSIVGAAGRRLLDQARVLAGPAGLAHDLDLTRAVDDLLLYLGQQNPDGDATYLGQQCEQSH